MPNLVMQCIPSMYAGNVIDCKLMYTLRDWTSSLKTCIGSMTSFGKRFLLSAL